MAGKPRNPKGGAKAGAGASSGASAGGVPRAPVTGSPQTPPSQRASRTAHRPGFVHGTGEIAPLAQIERLRGFRVFQDRTSIGAEVERLAQELAKHEQAAGGLARAWASLAPAALQRVTRVERLHGGVLTVIASDASAKYDAEMWLAEAGLSVLRGASARTLRRVKVVIG